LVAHLGQRQFHQLDRGRKTERAQIFDQPKHLLFGIRKSAFATV
jgi:hypothetical protein